MKCKRIASAILCFILMINCSCVNVQAAKKTDSSTKITSFGKDWPKGPSIDAGAAVVMDVSTGVVLYEKNGTQKNYPASITKILTSLLALENCNSLSEKVTFSKNAVFSIEKGSSSCAIDVGEELALQECLYGVMLESANEISNAVAEHISGSIEDFAELMNEKVTELGGVNSHFANANGLFDENHYTCAYDMALIASAAIRNTTFEKITSTRVYFADSKDRRGDERIWRNHHKFINKERSYDGCIGGKTGYTQRARHTLVTYAKRGNMTLVCVIMNEDGAVEQYTDTAKLLDYGFDNFTLYNTSSNGTDDFVKDVFFNKFDNVINSENPMLSMDSNSSVILPNGVNLNQVEKKVEYSESSANENEQLENVEVGKVVYSYEGQVVGQGKILLNTIESELPTTIHKVVERKANGKTASLGKVEQTADAKETKKKNLKPMIITIIAVAVVLLILGYYFVVERPRIRRRKAYLARRRRRYYD